MPPLLPRPRLPRLPSTTTAAIPSSKSTIPTRCFGTTPPARSVKIPPESPRYINLDKRPQSEEVLRPPTRGHLPVPRRIFHPTKGHCKASPEYLASTAPVGAAAAAGEPPGSENQAWRRRLADSRRAGLAEGLSGLWARELRKQQRERAASAAKARDRRRAAVAADHPEDALTTPTVRASTARDTAVPLDPLRFERAAESAARTAALARFRSEGRRDAVMELYVAARNFIVDEAELAERVEAVFAPDYFKRIGGSVTGNLDPQNMWDVYGSPPTVASMIKKAERRGGSLTEQLSDEAHKTAARQRALAEALTGGKIPV